MDWLDLLAVQGTLKSLLQHHSSEASILQCSAFFTVQLSYPYMTTGKTIALTRWAFVGKVMSLLFNMLSAAASAKSLQSCPTLCDPIDGSPPGSLIPGILQARMGCHFLLQCMKVKSESEVAQSCPTPNDPMECSLPGSSVHGIFQARVLEFQLQHHSFQRNLRVDLLQNGLVGSPLQSKGLSRVFSNTTVQKHQFFGAQLSSQSNSHIHT